MRAHIPCLPPINYGRLGETTIDVAIMRTAKVVLVGTGGGRLVAELLARSGLGTLVIVDPDAVDGTRNPLTQGHHWAEHGEQKALTTARACTAINPDVTAIPLGVDWETACKDREDLMASANFLIACTDSYAANRSVRRYGLTRAIDVAFPAACIKASRNAR
jgi:tRNA A37 threonylcarbamoyladenosine dehydratase